MDENIETRIKMPLVAEKEDKENLKQNERENKAPPNTTPKKWYYLPIITTGILAFSLVIWFIDHFAITFYGRIVENVHIAINLCLMIFN